MNNKEVFKEPLRDRTSVYTGRKGTVYTTPLKAIKAMCVSCMGGMSAEVPLCAIETCPLHVFRMGKNPHRKKRILSEEEKRELTARLPKPPPRAP